MGFRSILTRIRETSGPTLLRVGSIADGQYAKRDGSTLVGGTPSGTGSGSNDRALVDPTGLSWSWINQGSAAIATQGAALWLSCVADSADSWKLRVKTAPSKPYSVIIHLVPLLIAADFAACMVGWLQSSDNKLAGLMRYSGSVIAYNSRKYTNPTTFSANYQDRAGSESYLWIKLTDDASNRQIYVSHDGNNWIQLHSVATNDFLTPDRLVFGINPRNGTYAAGVLLDSWEEGV